MQERPYNPDVDTPMTGWDAKNIEYYLSIGAELIIDNDGDVWTADRVEYVGKVTTV